MSIERQVVKTIASIINNQVNFKFVPEAFEQIIIEAVTGRLLDFVVSRLSIDYKDIALTVETVENMLELGNSEDFKDSLITKANEIIDIPFLNENQELELIEAFVSVLIPLLARGNSTILMGK